MPISLEDLKTANDNGLEVLTRSRDRLTALRPGSLPSVLRRINAELQFVDTEITHLESIRAHLDAAGVTVKPMSAEDENALNEEAGKLDAAIKSDAIVSASLDFIHDAVNTATKVGDLTTQNT